jgi:hypothetical protein
MSCEQVPSLVASPGGEVVLKKGVHRLVCSAKMRVELVTQILEYLEANGYEVSIEVDVAKASLTFVGPQQAIYLAAVQVSRVCGNAMTPKSVGA